jgi:hypothetical protein
VGALRIALNPFLGILDGGGGVDVDPHPPRALWALFLLLLRQGILGEPLGVSSPKRRFVARAERGCLLGGTELS